MLVVILQAGSFDGAAEMVFHLAASIPVRRRLYFAFTDCWLLAQAFFRRVALLLQLTLHRSQRGLMVFLPVFKEVDHADHQNESQHAAGGQNHAGPHDGGNTYIALLMAFLDVPAGLSFEFIFIHVSLP